MPRRTPNWPVRLIVLIILLGVAYFGWREYQRMVREHPERFPWTPLSLADPVGPFTGRKLAALTDDAAQCATLLDDAGSGEVAVPARTAADGQCGYADGVRLQPGQSGAIRFTPSGLVTACPVAAALIIWERDVVQPAARRHLGTTITRIDHAGSYSCRRISGRAAGQYSEHATADAVDVTGFRTGDGTSVSVLSDWTGDPGKAAFLREVRDGACDLFSTVLSPDYNAAHADHFHLDQAKRGATGWRGCR